MNHNGDDAPPNTDPQTAFTELGAIVLGAQPLDQVLERVAELSQQAIPGAGAVSVTLLDGDQHDQEDQAYEFEHATFRYDTTTTRPDSEAPTARPGAQLASTRALPVCRGR